MPNGMADTRAFLRSMGLPEGDAHDLPSSTKRFPDGGQWRVEIPSVEGPNALRAVFDTADALGVPIHRVSQGSGVMLLTDDELDQMAKLGGAAISRSASSSVRAPDGIPGRWRRHGRADGRAEGARHGSARAGGRGRAASVRARHQQRAGDGRGPARGVGAMKKGGRAAGGADPQGLGHARGGQSGVGQTPRRARHDHVQRADRSLPGAAGRDTGRVDMPLDIYIEVPDDIGGFIRHYEIAEIVRVCAPVYLKFGLRNAPNIYPSGTHLEATAISLTKERLRRAKLGWICCTGSIRTRSCRRCPV